jgi:cysteinyl-tRNA synthetase
MFDSYNRNQQHGFISFAANKRELNNIPDFPANPFNQNEQDINNITEAKNFLYLINPENFSNKKDFIEALTQTNYDLLIIDLFLFDEILTANEIESLKTKQNGSKRLVICYLSIGEAENYRYYWQKSWKPGEPEWLQTENKNWEGNYKVHYWHTEWKSIIYGQTNSYLDKIIEAKFDGVYLDLIDAFEYFEMQ